MDLADQFRIQCYGYTGEGARNWAIGLRFLRQFIKLFLADTWNNSLDIEGNTVQFRACIISAKINLTHRMNTGGRKTRGGELSRKEHGVARCVSRADQFFRVGLTHIVAEA